MSDIKFFEHSNTKNPKHLVIFLHGYGANGENLLTLSGELENSIKDAHFISPNAIQPWEGGFPNCYQWFSLGNGLSKMNPQELSKIVQDANDVLWNFIEEQLKRFNLEAENLILAGFSQGAMMAMYQGLTNTRKLKGIIAFSGRLILPEDIGKATKQKPEICLIHGTADSVVPFSHFLEAEKTLKKLEVPFESHEIKNLDHSIDIGAVRAAQSFLKRISSN